MIIKRRFRPLGKLLQRFGRGQINNYTHTTNMASRADVPPVWEDNAQQPLVWSDPDVNPEPADFSSDAAPAPVQRRSTVQRAPQPTPAPAPTPGDSGPRRTPPDLWKIHEAHTQMLEEEGYRMPPSPWAKPVDPDTVSRLPAPPTITGKPVQRRAQTTPAADPTPASRPANIPATPAPQTVSSRRRGRVIEETTPPVEDEESPVSVPEASFAPDEEAPAWETELETAEDQPDLFEALMSEGVVQRRNDPDLSDAETFTPKFRPTPTETPAERPSTPESSSNASPASTPNVQRSEASQTPRTERPAQTPPQTPTIIQGSAAPVQRQTDDASDYYAGDEADMPPSLVPASGTTEADLLDMLGLPPDTPVRGLNPAAAAQSTSSSESASTSPSTPTSTPANPVQRQSAPPAVQRTESSTSPAQTNTPSMSTPSNAPANPVQRHSTPPAVQRTESTPSAPANPTPRTSQRVNIPPTSPYKSQTTGEQITPDDIPASPPASTSLSNQTVMRQPQVPEAPEDVSDWSEEPPAVGNFTSFFEDAEAAQDTYNWPESASAEATSADWSEPDSPVNEPSGESLPRANPFPMSNPPAAITSSAPTRPTPRVQRAEADLPYIDEDAAESSSEVEDTQPINLPLTGSSAPTPEASSTRSLSEANSPRSINIQRASVPPAESSGEPYPRAVDPSFIEEEQFADEPVSWSASDDVEPQSAEYTSQPSQIAPDAPRSTRSSPGAPVQRSKASSQPETPDANPRIGYHIEGLPENRGTAPTGQISRAKTGDKTMGGDKLGGKIVPEGMSMALPGKTTTDSVPGAVTAPTSGKTDGGSNIGGKAGGSPVFAGKTDVWSAPPPSSSAATSPMSTLPEDDGSGAGAPAPEGSDESSEANPESAPGGQNDVDKLARDVYNLLRDRLRVEQERRPKR